MSNDPMLMLAFAEYGTITWLLQNEGLNERGLGLALTKCRMPSERTATGNLASVRDQLEHQVIVALSKETGRDASHWANGMDIDVPPDARYLTDGPDAA